MIEDFLEGNRRFVEEEFRVRPDHYGELATAQHPRVLWIGCSDSRASESTITDSPLGAIFVHRNVANMVAYNDVNVAAVLEYGLRHLHIPDVVICGHYGCGGMAALLGGVDESYIADWLLIASGARTALEALPGYAEMTEKERLARLAEENVRLQMTHLRSFALIRGLAREGRAPRIHGWMYSFETGRITVLEDGRDAQE